MSLLKLAQLFTFHTLSYPSVAKKKNKYRYQKLQAESYKTRTAVFNSLFDIPCWLLDIRFFPLTTYYSPLTFIGCGLTALSSLVLIRGSLFCFSLFFSVALFFLCGKITATNQNNQTKVVSNIPQNNHRCFCFAFNHLFFLFFN